MSERDIFDAALAINDPTQRAAYLEHACAGNPRLRERIDGLLSADGQVGSFLESPAAGLAATVDDPISERAGTVIGPYKLLEQIGEGGFGVVFMAEQTQPVRRKVALKVLKPGMDTRQVVARFEAERQALALMDHPNIAYVFDGGETPSGRPYFVMELICGVPITQFCDENRLTPRERLGLFADVCKAVQHAHQKGVIHRDLKPSNVLVTLHDGTPVPKVIDFGIAKATGQQLTDKTLFTNFAQMVGTPLYMSPEQAEMNGLDVDTRSDVYSLGVLLYELLTGTTPLDRERLRTAGYDEICRAIREEEAARPSTRLSTLGQAAATVSANRGSDPWRLSRSFRGELDWVVLKALEKDRNRRYESAHMLAADVQSYLNDEPVLANPPSAGYRLRKFLRRNKGPALAAALVLLALVTGVAVSTWQAVRATGAERDAVAGWAIAEEQRNAAQANFLRACMMLNERPSGTQMEWLATQPSSKARTEALEKGLAFYQGFLKTPGPDPAERLFMVHLYVQCGEIQGWLGQNTDALESYGTAIHLLEQLRADFPREEKILDLLVFTHRARGPHYASTGRPIEAADAYRQAIAVAEELQALFPAVPWHRRSLALSWFNLAKLQRSAGRPAAAEESYGRALVFMQGLHDEYPNQGELRRLLVEIHSGIAWLHSVRDDRQPRHAALAMEHARKVVALQPEHHDGWHTLGVAHCRLGHWKEALAAIEKSRQMQGGAGPPSSLDRFFEAIAYHGLGDREKARRYYDEAVAWMQQHAPQNIDLRGLRAETAALLGIAEPKNRP